MKHNDTIVPTNVLRDGGWATTWCVGVHWESRQLQFFSANSVRCKRVKLVKWIRPRDSLVENVNVMGEAIGVWIKNCWAKHKWLNCKNLWPSVFHSTVELWIASYRFYFNAVARNICFEHIRRKTICTKKAVNMQRHWLNHYGGEFSRSLGLCFAALFLNHTQDTSSPTLTFSANVSRIDGFLVDSFHLGSMVFRGFHSLAPMWICWIFMKD